MSPQQDQHILIIGAGVCGLAVAQGLKKAGIPFTIFDAEGPSAVRPREWTMAVHWGLPMLESLLPEDLVDRIRSYAVVDPSLDFRKYPNSVLPLYDGVTGKLLKEIDSEGSRVSRRRLRTVCGDGIEVKWDHVIDSIEYNTDGTVSAFFSNGASYAGALLVGADGAHSTVRKQIFGAAASETQSLDLVIVNVAFHYPDAEKAKFVRSAGPVSYMASSPDCLVMVSVQDAGQDPADAESWLIQLVITWEGNSSVRMSNEEKHAELRRKAADLAEPFKSAIFWMPRDVQINYGSLGSWSPPTNGWDTRDGRVTLAGDAAHAMPPFRGQGLNNALNDAYNLVATIKTMNLENRAEAIQEYSREVAERGSKEVQLALKSGEMMMDYKNFPNSAIMKQGLKKLT